MNFTIQFAMILVGGYKIFLKPTLNLAEFVNEAVLYFIQYCGFIFSDYNQNVMTKHRLGYFIGSLILTHLTLNIIFIVRRNARKTFKKFRIAMALKRAAKAQKKLKG